MTLNFNTLKIHRDCQTVLHKSDEKGILGIKNEAGEVKIYRFATLDEMTSENYHQMSIKEIYDVGNVLRNRATDVKVKDEITGDVKNILDVESQKIHNTIDKINATWITAIKWIAALTIIFLPVAAMIQYFQNSSRAEAKKQLAEVKSLETALMISETFKPLQNQEKIDTAPVKTYKENLKHLYKILQPNVKIPQTLEGNSRKNYLVPEVVASDFPRFTILRLNGNEIYSNSDTNLKDTHAAYQKILDIFGEDANNAPVTNAVLVGLTQAQAGDIIEATIYLDNENKLHAHSWKQRCLDIQVQNDVVIFEIKAISYEIIPDSDEDASHPLAAYIISRKIEAPIAELKAALEEENPDLLVNIKGEDKISDSLLIRKPGEDLFTMPKIINSETKAFFIPENEANAILRNLS